MPTKLAALRKSSFKTQSCRCHYCRFPIWEKNPESFALVHKITRKQAQWFKCTAEHLVAKQDGGLDTPENIVAACRWCNSRRHMRKTVPAPKAYLQLVQHRVRRGHWHFMSSVKNLMVGELNNAGSAGQRRAGGWGASPSAVSCMPLEVPAWYFADV